VARSTTVTEQDGRRAVISQDKIQAAVFVIVEDRDAATVFDTVRSVHPADLSESFVAIVSEEDVSFTSV
jgi:hypothetical protein